MACALVASWLTVTVAGAPAAVYNLGLINELAQDVQVGSLSGATGPPVTMTRADGSQPLSGSRYRVVVQPDIGGNLGPWASSVPMVVAALSPPSAVTLVASGTSLSLTWSAPPIPAPLIGPLTYQAVLMQGASEVGEATAEASPVTPFARSDLQPPVAGQVYTARLNATEYSVLTGGHTSDWATSPAVTIMDVPQLTQVSYDAGFTTVQWTASTVPGAGYDIMLQPTQAGFQSFQATVNGPSPGGLAPTSTRISMAGQSRWRYYTAQIRAHTPNSAGGWSSPVAFAALEPPAGLKVEMAANPYGVTHLTASWTSAVDQVF